MDVDEPSTFDLARGGITEQKTGEDEMVTTTTRTIWIAYRHRRQRRLSDQNRVREGYHEARCAVHRMLRTQRLALNGQVCPADMTHPLAYTGVLIGYTSSVQYLGILLKDL